jgi:hypothetical protein
MPSKAFPAGGWVRARFGGSVSAWAKRRERWGTCSVKLLKIEDLAARWGVEVDHAKNVVRNLGVPFIEIRPSGAKSGGPGKATRRFREDWIDEWERSLAAGLRKAGSEAGRMRERVGRTDRGGMGRGGTLMPRRDSSSRPEKRLISTSPSSTTAMNSPASPVRQMQSFILYTRFTPILASISRD